MTKRAYLFVLAPVLLYVCVAGAQYPIMDAVAKRVTEKYQSSTCEDLWQKRGKPESEMEQKMIGFLKNDPAMRAAFFNQIAGPVMNKMFECGMIP
jgi:hypothetical protein